MNRTVELLLTPAEFEARSAPSLVGTACIVFDVLRATSTLVTALANGAEAVEVVGEIADALRRRETDPRLLLAGERNGRRITADLTGSIEFDLGNSPREFTADRVAGRRIVMTTTNGTRAIQACHGASLILSASFLNLSATVEMLRQSRSQSIRIVAAGTGQWTSFEDVLGAGALLSALPAGEFTPRGDSCLMACELYAAHQHDLAGAFARSVNGRRLQADLELAADLAFCSQRDVVPHPVSVEDQVAHLGPPSQHDDLK
jgi:2-phosphosulfolactate phosphatase